MIRAGRNGDIKSQNRDINLPKLQIGMKIRKKNKKKMATFLKPRNFMMSFFAPPKISAKKGDSTLSANLSNDD